MIAPLPPKLDPYCQCICHYQPGVMHVVACCRAPAADLAPALPSADYVRGLIEFLQADPDNIHHLPVDEVAVLRQALAARPDQPAADTRDADMLYNAWLGLRVLQNIAKIKQLSGAADVVTPLIAEIEAAHPEFAPRSALRTASFSSRAIIGSAKP